MILSNVTCNIDISDHDYHQYQYIVRPYALVCIKRDISIMILLSKVQH